jgi:hypothetical protein
MFKAIVIIGALNASAAVQIEDERGPYNTAPECYYRTAQMIRDAANKTPVVYATGICIKFTKNELRI